MRGLIMFHCYTCPEPTLVQCTSRWMCTYVNVNAALHLTKVLVGQWQGVRLVIEWSQVRLLAGVLSRQLGQLSLPSLRGR